MARPRGELARIAALHGYQRVPGRAENFVKVSDTPGDKHAAGEVVSRRQIENLRYEAAGYESWSEYQRFARTQEFQAWAYYAKEANPSLTYNQIVAPQSQFSQDFVAAARGGFGTKMSTQAGQAFHRLLVYLDLREEDWDFDIGETADYIGAPQAA